MYKKQKLYHYTSNDAMKTANSGFLMGCFMMINLGITADAVWNTFGSYKIQFLPFRDISKNKCEYECTLYDCFRGLELAMRFGWYNYKTFDERQYYYNAQAKNGGFSWIIPGKLIAFSDPANCVKNGLKLQNCVKILKQLGVSIVIRLNDPLYDQQLLISEQI